MAIYYADLGKSGTGDGSFGNQYGKDQWDTIDPAGLGSTALQIKGMTTYTRDIKVCGLNTSSKWPLITSQDPAVPFRINAPGHSVQFNQPSPQFFQGTDELSNAIIYCNDISLPATHDCFLSVENTWQFPGGIGGDVLKNCVIYALANYIAMTDPLGTIKNSLIYELATGYHLLKTQGVLDTVLTNDTNLAGLTDGSWTDNGTTYGYTNHGGVPSGWDDADLYNYAIGTKDDVQNYVPSWVTFPVTPTTPRKGIHYAIEIFSNSLDAWASLTDSSVGIANGVFRYVTDRPSYDGSTVVPEYGANEINVGGASIAGVNSNIWKEGIIQKDGFTSNPSREIDIVACGQYATDFSFSFKIRNDQLFWKYCADNNIEFTGRRVVMWIVINDVFYQCARGRIINNPYTETDYEFDAQDDAKLIHKMLPPLTSNPTNNPDVPDSSAGQAIPIVMGDVPYSKILKLTNENTFIDLTMSNGTAFQVAAAVQYDRSSQPITGPYLLYLHTTQPFFFTANKLSGYYVQAVAGCAGNGDVPLNKDVICRITGNDESEIDYSPVGYKTKIWLSSPLLSDTTTLFPDFIAGGSGKQYSLDKTSLPMSGVSTVYFKISDFSLKTQTSVKTVSMLVRDEFNNPYLWTWDTTLKEYISEEGAASVNLTGSNVTLISNAASSDGKVTIYSKINFPITNIGVSRDGWKNPAATEQYSDKISIGEVTNSDLSKYKDFVIDIMTADVNQAWLFADFSLKPLSVIPDNIYLCFDFDILNRYNHPELANTAQFLVLLVSWAAIDVYGGGCGSGASSPGNAVNGDYFSPSDPNNNKVNLIPLELIKVPGSDTTNILGLQCRKYTVPLETMKKAIAIDKGVFSLPQAVGINVALCLSTYYTNNLPSPAPSPSFNIRMKEVMLVGEGPINTFNGDLYTRVSGELTGLQTTDPLHETNDVYHVFMHILEDYDSIPKNLVDYGDLPLTRTDWHVGRTLTERKNSIDYLNELCAHSFVGMFGGRTGKRCLRSFQNMDSYGTPTVTHDSNIIVRDSIDSFEKTDISQLFNSFLLQYNWDPGLQQYIRAFIVSLIDQYSDFPDVNSTSNDYAITPSAVSPALADVTALIAYYGFIYGSTFYTTDGSDTTDTALADAKGSALVAGDAFQCLGDTVSWLGYQNSNTIPTWFNFLGGLIGDPDESSRNYLPSKGVWDMCRKSFVTNQTVKQAQSDISELPWYIDTMLFDPANLSGHGTNSSAWKFLYLLALWTTLQKYMVSYRIPINTTTVVTELLDHIYFKDKIYTDDQLVEGWIVHIEPDPSTDQLVINTILKPTTISGQSLIIERGILPIPDDTITEGVGGSDTITEPGD